MDSPPPQGFPLKILESTVGSLFFATIISMGLWGAGTLQLYFYYNKYPNDSTWLKIYVFIVWFLDTLHQALLIGMAHGYLIAHFGSYEGLMHLDIMLVLALLVGGFICAMVQLIFVMRIWRLSEKNAFLLIIVGSLVLGQFVATCMYFAKAVQSQTFEALHGAMIITRIVNSITAAADTTIALSLVVLLHRTRSGFKRSETTINRLIVFTINTGLVTSLCAILGLVLGIVFFDTLLFMFFYLMVARLYTNSLLATLNSRKGLRKNLFNASGSTAVPQASTDKFKTVTFQTPYDNNGTRTGVASRQPSEGTYSQAIATQLSVMLDAVVDSPVSTESRYSQSTRMYSVDLEGLQAVPSGESTPTKFQNLGPRSDNWI